jgi:hypothetical protein
MPLGPNFLGTQSFCSCREMNDQEPYRVPGRWALATGAGTWFLTAHLEFFDSVAYLDPDKPSMGCKQTPL